MKRFILAAALLLAVAGVAQAGLTPSEKAMLDRINGDPALRAEALARLSDAPVVPAAKREAKPAPVNVATATPADGSQPAEPPAVYVPEQSKCAGFTFLLRQDWTDIDLFKCPGAVSDAAGAKISFSDDLANRNRIWTVDGTAAINYNSLQSRAAWWQPTYFNAGLYGTINREFNSATAFTASDADKLAYGAYLQLGYTNTIIQNFFRLRGGAVEDRIAGTTAANAIFEYIPVVDWLFIHTPTPALFGSPYVLRFDPIVSVQYAEVTGDNQVLAINNRTRALPVGVEATLRLLPAVGMSAIARFRAAVTYRWSQDAAYSGRDLSWFQSNLTYNLDPKGNIAVGFDYQRGNDQDTGKFKNIYTIALKGKFNYGSNGFE